MKQLFYLALGMADIYLPNLNDSVMKKRSSLSHFNIPLVFERLIGSYNKFDYTTEEDLTWTYFYPDVCIKS